MTVTTPVTVLVGACVVNVEPQPLTVAVTVFTIGTVTVMGTPIGGGGGGGVG